VLFDCAQRALQKALLHIAQNHVKAGARKHVRNAVPHGPGADNSHFLNVHNPRLAKTLESTTWDKGTGTRGSRAERSSCKIGKSARSFATAPHLTGEPPARGDKDAVEKRICGVMLMNRDRYRTPCFRSRRARSASLLLTALRAFLTPTFTFTFASPN